jgi:4-hydroxybenzoate polyprenyltransferase
MSALAGTFTNVQHRWATAGTAPLRLLRPSTRLWLDTIMPIAVLFVLDNGHPPLITVVLFVAMMNLVHAAAHVLNDLQDVETDRRSSEILRASRPIATGAISETAAKRAAAVFVVAGIAAAFAIEWYFGLIALVFTGIVVMNEIPPVRVQSRGYTAQLYTTVGVAAFLLSVRSIAHGASLSAALPFVVFVATYLGLAETLVKDVRDVDNDREGGKLTTAVKHGPAHSTRLAVLAYVIAAGGWAWFAAAYPGLVAWPIVLGSASLFAWTVYTAVAARILSRRFSKPVCVSLHQGSELTFTILNVATILAIALS